jgi:sorbitol/mannitol transport system permease protein
VKTPLLSRVSNSTGVQTATAQTRTFSRVMVAPAVLVLLIWMTVPVVMTL